MNSSGSGIITQSGSDTGLLSGSRGVATSRSKTFPIRASNEVGQILEITDKKQVVKSGHAKGEANALYKLFTFNCLQITKEMATEIEKSSGKKVYLYSLDDNWTPSLLDGKRIQVRDNQILFSSQTVERTVTSIEQALNLYRLVCPECDIDHTGRSIVMIADYIPMNYPTNEFGNNKIEKRKFPKQTRNKKRHSNDHSIAVLNQLSQQVNPNDQRLPLYNITGEYEKTHEPSFNCQLTFRDRTVTSLNSSTKFDAKTKCARQMLLSFINDRPRDWTPTAISTFNEWKKDLTQDGDVESNPGPITTKTVTLGKQFSITTSPQTLSFSAIPNNTYDTNIILMAQISGTNVGTGILTFATNTIAYNFYDDAILNINLGTMETTGNYVPTLVWTGSTSITFSINLIFKPLSFEASNVVIANQPIWTTEFGPPPTISQVAITNVNKKKMYRRHVRSRKNENSTLPKEDLTKDGDVEANPGPNSAFSYDPVPEDFDFEEDTGLTIEQINALKKQIPAKTTVNIQICDDESLLDKMEGYETKTNTAAEILLEHIDKQLSQLNQEDKLHEVQDEPNDKIEDQSCVKEYLNHLSHIASFNTEVGNYFSTICYVADLPISNRFSLLINSEDIPHEPIDLSDLPIVKKPKSPPKPATEEKKLKIERPVKPKPLEKTEEQKSLERQTVRNRIVKTLTENMSKIVTWIQKPMSRSFRMEILDLVFGINWQNKIDFNQYEWLCYCELNNISHSDAINVLLSFDKKWNLLSFQQQLIISENMNFRADLEAKKTHNKVMHAYNGNPLAQTFDEVVEMKEFLSFAEESESVLQPYTGMEAEKYITNIAGDVNPNQSRLFDQDRLRGNIYPSHGALPIHNAVSTIPFTNMIPRTIRQADNTLANSVNRIQVTECNVAEYFVNPIEPTELSRTISDQIKNNQSSNWRRDNNSIAGFNSFDIATVNTALLPRGLSLESMLLKLDLLHSIMAMKVQPAMISKSLYQVVDNFTIPTVDIAAEVGINNSPVFGENCGGDDPVYPWNGGHGTIAFHLTLQSVPEERRDMAIFVPPGLLQSARDGAEALALFVLTMTEWPFGIYTVTKQTTDTEGANIGNQVFVPTQTITRVGGARVIDVILPRRYPVANPTTQQQANAMTVIRPQAGPAAAVGLAASALLDVNYINAAAPNAAIQYQLTNYLYTWAVQFDITTIRQYAGRLAAMVGIKSQLWACHEINVALCQVAPKMTTGLTGSAGQARGSPQQSDLCYSSLLAMTRSTANFPLEQPVAADFRVFETFSGTWNKVILGLATAPNLTSEQNMSVPFELGDPRVNFWERLEAIPMAAAWTIYYHARGVSSMAWNNSYTNINNVWLQNMARKTYSTTQSTGTILPARFGKIPKNIMRNMYEREPAKVSTSVGGQTYDITHFERWLPGNSYATVYNQQGGEITVFPPTLIPDIWIQYSATHIPKMVASFPPVFGYKSVQGFGNDDKLIPFRNVNNDLVSTYMEPFVANQAYFPIRQGPNVNDKVIWNSRLWMTENLGIINSVQYLDYSGANIPEARPPPGELPVGRSIPLLPGESQPHGVTNMSTTCIPRYSNDGRRIFVYLSTASSVLPVLACKRATRLARSAWLLLNVYIEPQLQLLDDESEDIFDQLTNKSFLDVQKSAALSAEDNIPAKKELTDLQAVDPSNLPSTLDTLRTMPQPAPLMNQPTSTV